MPAQTSPPPSERPGESSVCSEAAQSPLEEREAGEGEHAEDQGRRVAPHEPDPGLGPKHAEQSRRSLAGDGTIRLQTRTES